MRYTTLIARRYLVSSKRVSLISVITGISVAGITLGVAALIVVLSVMNGFFDLVRDLLVSFDPHVRVVSTEGGLRNADSLATLIRAQPEVVSASPYVEGKALLAYDGAADVNKVVIVRGVDSTAAGELPDRVTYGSFDLGRRQGPPGLVMGSPLASRLGVFPGDGASSSVALLSAAGVERLFAQGIGLPPYVRFSVSGLYDYGSVFDENYVFVDLVEAQRLFRSSGAVTGIDVRLQQIDQADGVQRVLQQQLPATGYEVLTWYDIQRSLYDVMRLEKWGASLILVLVIIVAAFNIIGSLTMIVIEKRRDLGVLQAMGVSRAGIRRIFLTEGVLIALVGCGLGLVIGLGLCWLQAEFGLVSLAGAESFIIDTYPVSVQVPDVLAVLAVVFTLCLIAAWYPAHRAAQVEPARAVRNE
ncbi:MAG: ABC transporter permease [Bacteroidota bacterium]